MTPAPPASHEPPFGLPGPVLALLALCVLPELSLQFAERLFAAPPGLRQWVYALGAFQPDLFKTTGPLFFGQPVTMFFTYGFLHVSLMHLVINMIGLVVLGRLILERRTGETFVTFYILAMVGAAEMFVLIGPPSGAMAGASGALFGLLGVYAADTGYFTPSGASEGRITPQISRLLLATLVLILSDQLSRVLLGSPVAWQAHAGGFLTGAIAALIAPPRGFVTLR